MVQLLGSSCTGTAQRIQPSTRPKQQFSSEQDETLEGRMNLTLSWINMTALLYEKLKTI